MTTCSRITWMRTWNTFFHEWRQSPNNKPSFWLATGFVIIIIYLFLYFWFSLSFYVCSLNSHQNAKHACVVFRTTDLFRGIDCHTMTSLLRLWKRVTKDKMGKMSFFQGGEPMTRNYDVREWDDFIAHDQSASGTNRLVLVWSCFLLKCEYFRQNRLKRLKQLRIKWGIGATRSTDCEGKTAIATTSKSTSCRRWEWRWRGQWC